MQTLNIKQEFDANELELGTLLAAIRADAPDDGDQTIPPAVYVWRIDQLLRRNEHLSVLLS